MDLLRGIERFVQVVDDGSISAAARTLDLTPGAISMSISKLESHFGTRLFDRTKRHLEVTPEGRRLHAECRGILDEVRSARDYFLNAQNAVAGRLRIEASATIARRLIMPLWGSLSRMHPALELEIHDTRQVFGTAMPFFDIAVRMGPFEDSDLVARQLGYDHLWTVASPGYLQRHGAPRMPEDLHSHHCLNYVDPLSGRAFPLTFLANGSLLHLEIQGQLTFNSDEPRLSAALEGLGVLQTAGYQVQGLVASGELVQFLREWIAPSPPIKLLFRKDQFLTTAARVFIDAMSAAYPPERAFGSLDPADRRACPPDIPAP